MQCHNRSFQLFFYGIHIQTRKFRHIVDNLNIKAEFDVFRPSFGSSAGRRSAVIIFRRCVICPIYINVPPAARAIRGSSRQTVSMALNLVINRFAQVGKLSDRTDKTGNFRQPNMAVQRINKKTRTLPIIGYLLVKRRRTAYGRHTLIARQTVKFFPKFRIKKLTVGNCLSGPQRIGAGRRFPLERKIHIKHFPCRPFFQLADSLLQRCNLGIDRVGIGFNFIKIRIDFRSHRSFPAHKTVRIINICHLLFP